MNNNKTIDEVSEELHAELNKIKALCTARSELMESSKCEGSKNTQSC